MGVSLVGPNHPMERFFLAQDDDAHWYCIPVSRRQDWESWNNSFESIDEDVPDYVVRVGGSPALVTFADPRID